MSVQISSNTFDSAVLESPTVAPARDFYNQAVDAANKYADEAAKVLRSEDHTETGRQKLLSRAESDFNEATQATTQGLENALQNANKRLDEEIEKAVNFDRPVELNPASQLEATFAIREAENMSPGELVAAYEAAINSRDYIKRRAIEAAAGTVLKGNTSSESMRYQLLKKSIYQPSNPEIEAARSAINHIQKMALRLDYAMQQTRKTYREPFGKI